MGARIYLIGAGPGDPALLTVKGQRALALADVVVYDHLVHATLLHMARPDAEKIDVGPTAPRPLEQDAICLLLAEKAREGKTVARLKWGDPFMFNSGGQETLFLREQEIPFDVVPGIPPGLGSPTYAGIPITHPDAGDTLTFVRGHGGDSNQPPDVAWNHLADLKGTVVTSGDGPQLAAILRALQRHGRTADEPAALIYDGTRPSQHTIHGTLAELQDLVSQPDHTDSPVLVVGQVTTLRKHLRWFDERPLFGTRVVVTRARAQATDLITQLEDLGAEPIEVPTICIKPPLDSTPLTDACSRLDSFDWVVLTSVNAVTSFMTHVLEGPGDVRDLKGVGLCAVGPATAEALAGYGLRVDLIPDKHRSEGIVEALCADRNLADARILLPRGNLAGDLLPDALKRSGASVTTVTAYRTEAVDLTQDHTQDIYRLLLEGRIDVVTFTSGSSGKNFADSLGQEQVVDLLRPIVVACIGPVTAAVAERLGITTTIMPTGSTIPAMVKAIADHIRTRRHERTNR